MAIIETIDESLFISRFEDYKRVITKENKNGNFTYKGLRHLFGYIDDLSEDTSENIVLDVIALCCDYSEYGDITEYLNDYGKDLIRENEETEEEFKERIENHINDNTTLIKFSDDLNDGFIIQQY